jgi:hypothetical protein
MDKAAVFIDGGHLAKVLKDFGEPKIDFLRMSNFFCEKAGAERLLPSGNWNSGQKRN